MKNTRNMGRPVVNKYEVPKPRWDAWSNEARKTFNTLYYSMRPTMQFVYVAPDAPVIHKKHWETLRYNVAWEAAEIVEGRKIGKVEFV